MNRSQSTDAPLLLPMPDHSTDRNVLVMIRRMAAHGLRDANAAMIGMNHFGNGFRQPLVLLRCYVAEVARASQRSIQIANCCAPRMTRDEGLMLETLALSSRAPERAIRNLQELTGSETPSRALTVAQGLNAALHNGGWRLEG